MKHIGFKTLLYKEIQRFMRIYSQTLIPPVITSLLYILIFGYSIGSRISDVHGFTYLEFIIPGLVMMGIISSSYSNTSSSLFFSKFQGNIQELLISPISNIEIVLGFILGGVVRGFIVGFLIAAIGFIFTGILLHNILFIILFALIVSFIFSSFGFLTALWADNFDRLNLFQTFLLTPMIYLGGIFYSISMLPGIWQKIAVFNPLLYFINGIRYGFLGYSDVNVIIAIISSIAVLILLLLLCYYLFKRGYKIKS